MRALGLVLVFAILVVGFAVSRSEEPKVVYVDDTPPFQQSSSTRQTSKDRAELGQNTSAEESGRCHTIGDGYLETGPIFGDERASHIHVNYWIPGEGVEWDVVLDGGYWRTADEIAGGRFWLYADCTDDQVHEQVELHQVRRGPRDAGWGDAVLFTRSG